MRTLIYKRTHHGDPDTTGQFGIHDCMGRVRTWDFDAVIGVGGLGPEPRSHGLDGKVNWIGIGAHKTPAADKRGPVVTFDHFLFFGTQGPDFETLAPQLAERIYSHNMHFLMNHLNSTEQREVARILALAEDAPPSCADRADRVTTSENVAPRTSAAKAIKGCSS